MTSVNRNSKPDTTLLVLPEKAGAAALATDVSQYRTALFYRPVPGKVNRARVRIYVSQAATGEPLSAPVQWRMYSLAGLPVAGEPVGPLVYFKTATVGLEANHGAGEGEWVDLGALPLAVDSWGCTWLALALSVDEDSGDVLADLTYARVRAVTVDPYFEPDGGGLDILEP